MLCNLSWILKCGKLKLLKAQYTLPSEHIFGENKTLEAFDNLLDNVTVFLLQHATISHMEKHLILQSLYRS